MILENSTVSTKYNNYYKTSNVSGILTSKYDIALCVSKPIAYIKI